MNTRFVELTGEDGEIAKELNALATPVVRLERSKELSTEETDAVRMSV